MKVSKNHLVDRHMFLSESDLNFLDDYVATHNLVNNYLEVVRDILNSLEVNDLNVKTKMDSMSKEVAIILSMLKNNNEEKYLTAKKQVEDQIQKNTTKKSSVKLPKAQTSEPE